MKHTLHNHTGIFCLSGTLGTYNPVVVKNKCAQSMPIRAKIKAAQHCRGW